ncbi:MAG: hypothetical protein D8M57_12895 [Candidatus Scalindua sp. AMX11]|nr:MAG: hypothetical protein DWQ00_12415 [Candidatus Scalindua sp.]TDE64527.1 MAG: hypothetical protein D8M57_12895 [Candidatus Scalindua sp. AMX11]GJQ58735.1 MAG: hypothetical protein SCALA701_15360 [Candidatus Scalindua sp.]
MARQWRMVQSYSKEEIKIWEYFRQGFFFGSQKFIDRIKSKYLSENPDVEIPQKRQVLRDTNPEKILKRAVKVIKCDTGDFLRSSRISDSDKLNRDLLIYLLWSTGWYNNQEIGNLFGLGYSSISRRVASVKSKITKDGKLNKRIIKITNRPQT